MAEIMLNWPASKDTVSEFTDLAVQIEVRRNPIFAQACENGQFDDGFLYDLGHAGRGLSDFPLRFPLLVPDTREKNRVISIHTTMPNFYRPLTDFIEAYLRNRGKLSDFVRYIVSMRALELLGEQPLDVTFSRAPGAWKVQSLQTDGYQTENNT